MPKISIIMSVYNVPNRQMARQAIGSMLSQTYQDFEFIICDDGSQGASASILKDICRQDGRIRLIQNKKNHGIAYSLNRCLKVAKGEYIARMDIDDASYPDRLEKQAGFLDSHPQYAFVGTWSDLFAGNVENVWGQRKMPEYPKKEDFMFGTAVIHASMMIRRAAMQAAGGYRVQWDTARAEDYELFMRLYAAGYRAYNIQEPLYQIREDAQAYQRRSYRHRIEEAHVRLVGFCRLGLYPKAIPYVLKPLVVGLIPQPVLKVLRREGIK